MAIEFTPLSISEWVDKIESMSGDPECAHSEEDKMVRALIEAIADGRASSPQDCAREALRSYSIDFDRWCA